MGTRSAKTIEATAGREANGTGGRSSRPRPGTSGDATLRIAISVGAFDAIAATLRLGSAGLRLDAGETKLHVIA